MSAAVSSGSIRWPGAVISRYIRPSRVPQRKVQTVSSPSLDLPQTQKLLHRQPQADHVLPIYRRLLQTPGQQGGEPVNPCRVQQNDFFLLFQYMCLFSHNKTSLYLIIP